MTSLVSLDALTLGPVLAVAAGAALVLLLDVVAPRLTGAHFALGAVSLAAGMALAVPGALGSESTPLRTLCLPAPVGACFYEAGPLASALQLGALASALVVLLLVWPADRAQTPQLRGGPAVLVALVLSATAGAAAVAAAHDLGSWLVALELATLPAIALVALRGTRSAGAGALSLLTTSLVSFAMVVLGRRSGSSPAVPRCSPAVRSSAPSGARTPARSCCWRCSSSSEAWASSSRSCRSTRGPRRRMPAAPSPSRRSSRRRPRSRPWPHWSSCCALSARSVRPSWWRSACWPPSR